MRSIICGALWVLLAGCGSVAAANRERLADIRTRAAFDLHCDGNALHFVPLKEIDGLVMQYGVEGCGQRSTYVYTWSGWVLDAAQDGAAKK